MDHQAPHKKFLKKLRLLPIMIVVAGLTFMVRVGDSVMSYRALSREVLAAQSPEKTGEKTDKKTDEKTDKKTGENSNASTENSPAPPPSLDELKSADSLAGQDSTGGPDDLTLPDAHAKSTGDADSETQNSPPKNWDDAKDIDTECSDIKADLYKDLTARRAELDTRDKTLSQREALLEAGQKELDRKYTELTGLRDQIQSLLKKQTEEEQTRIQSLVKIYTGMKPKDAARIFNTLDMDILVDVVGKMPEGKVSPIVAAMDADRARALTALLMEQKKLPDLPSQ